MLTALWMFAACNPPLPVDTADTSGPTDDTGIPHESGETGESGDSDTSPPKTDLDGDGAAYDVDCDDNDPSRYPGAPEELDGVDDDCDEATDVGVVDTFAGATRVIGEGSEFGFSLSAADGFVAVGAPGGIGSVYLFRSADLLVDATAADAHYVLESTDTDGLGRSVHMEDFDTDGYPELTVGLAEADGGIGRLEVLAGARVFNGGTGTAGVTTSGIGGDPSTNGGFGGSFAHAGAYVAVGAPNETVARGAVYLFAVEGIPTGAYGDATDAGRVAGGTTLGFGLDLAALDWDGDGVTDLAVGAPGSTGAGASFAAGEAYIFSGDDLDALALGGDPGMAVATLRGDVARAYLGYVAGGDVTGDGRDDLLFSSWSGAEIETRMAVVMEGNNTGTIEAGDARCTLSGFAVPTDDARGMALADLDGDDRADVLLGDYANSPGRLLGWRSDDVTCFGSMGPAEASFQMDGSELGDSLGAAALGFDVTGDSAPDVLVGAPQFGNGQIYVVPSAL